MYRANVEDVEPTLYKCYTKILRVFFPFVLMEFNILR